MDIKTINVCFNINKNYIPYLAVTISSILSNSPKSNFFNFFVISLEDLREGLNNIKIFFNNNKLDNEREIYTNYQITNIIADIGLLLPEKNIVSRSTPHTTVNAALRLLIPVLLKEIDKCIYLDVDVVVNTDLNLLFSIDLEDFYLGAVSGGLLNKYREDFKKKYHLNHGLYFSSGVMLFNLKNIRSNKDENLLNKCLHKFGNNNDIKYFDQDIINIAYNGFGRKKILALDPRWNFWAVGSGIYQHPWENIFIVHWSGGSKPWNEPYVRYIKLYIDYARLTNYFRLISEQLLRIIDERIACLNGKLSLKKYKVKLRLFDCRLFGVNLFPKKVAHYRAKIEKYYHHKEIKKIYYNKLVNLKRYLS